MLRTQLYADPDNLFLHDLVLDSCRRFPNKTALLDTSINRRFTYAEYGETIERLARGLIAAGLKPGEVVAIFLPNSWEFAAAYHATTLAGGFPTLLNPTYREREVRYQLENSGAAILITDGATLGRHQSSRPPQPASRLQHAPASSRNRRLLRPAETRHSHAAGTRHNPPKKPSPHFPTPAAPPDCPRA